MLLPPGDWDRANLLPMGQMIEMKKRQKKRNEASSENVEKSDQEKRPVNKQSEKEKEKETKEVAEKPPRNPLKRTSTPFGGLLDDIKYRYKVYLSDIKDGLNAQVVAATISKCWWNHFCSFLWLSPHHHGNHWSCPFV